MAKRITMQDLVERDACFMGRARFRITFGDTWEVTLESATTHYDLDYEWGAPKFLHAEQYAEYLDITRPAYATYMKARDDAAEVFQEATKEKCRAYTAALQALIDPTPEQEGAVFTEWKKNSQSERDTMNAVCEAARNEYYLICARAFATLYLDQPDEEEIDDDEK